MERLRAKAEVETLIKPEAGAPRPVPPADAPKAAPAASPSPPASKGAAK